MDSIALAQESYLILNALLDELDKASQVRQVGHVISKLKDIRFKLTVCKDDENHLNMEKNE
jgi:hypothetical protein